MWKLKWNKLSQRNTTNVHCTRKVRDTSFLNYSLDEILYSNFRTIFIMNKTILSGTSTCAGDKTNIMFKLKGTFLDILSKI